MIISASYKTDIPTFYGRWFANRLRASFCKIVNPYNNKVSVVSLRPDDVDGFVFWTKNIGPFLDRLADIHALGLPFVVQHTINGYPRELEQAVVDAERAVQHIHSISERYGPRVCVWRYDTILLSSLTTRSFHLDTFAQLAKALAGAIDEVTISFVRLYSKTIRNVTNAARDAGFDWFDPKDEWKRALVGELTTIAAIYNIRLTVCSQPDYLVTGAFEARCIDADRLADVLGRKIVVSERGNREGCRCAQARDIGEYDTCPHGCVYCYAVQDRTLALERFRNHDPESEFLFPPSDAIEAPSKVQPSVRRVQLSLFDELDDA